MIGIEHDATGLDDKVVGAWRHAHSSAWVGAFGPQVANRQLMCWLDVLRGSLADSLAATTRSYASRFQVMRTKYAPSS
jgi:hypothetical protein